MFGCLVCHCVHVWLRFMSSNTCVDVRYKPVHVSLFVYVVTQTLGCWLHWLHHQVHGWLFVCRYVLVGRSCFVIVYRVGCSLCQWVHVWLLVNKPSCACVVCSLRLSTETSLFVASSSTCGVVRYAITHMVVLAASLSTCWLFGMSSSTCLVVR